MHFAYPLPWWLAVLLAVIVAMLAFLEYRRPLVQLTTLQRGTLVALRALVLGALILFVFRPIAVLPPSGARDAVVPILVDVSRSMRVADADGRTRIARAAAVLKNDLLPTLSRQFRPELFTVGEGFAPVAPASPGSGDAGHAGDAVESLSAAARKTDLSGALRAAREHYRGQRVAGIVLVTDGGDTGQQPGADTARDAAAGP